MGSRKPKAKDFVGKTIASVNTRAVNSWTFKFTDGTTTTVEVEAVVPTIGLYGMAIITDE